MHAEEISYQISEDDYIATQRLYTKASRMKWFARGSVVIGLIILAFGLYLKIWPLTALGAFYAVLPGMARVLINEPLARRNFRRSPILQSRQTASLMEDGSGLRLASTVGDSKLAWPLIIRWVENERFLLIYIQPRLYFMIPKSADPENRLVGHLAQLLTKNVGAAAYSAP